MEPDATDEEANERFERLAAQFYRETGYMAPGKDPGILGVSQTYEERHAKWVEWLGRQEVKSNDGSDG